MLMVVVVRGVLGPLDGLEVDALLHHLPQRTHVAQPAHVFLQQIRCQINLFFRRETALG